jgi:hypothetical protein
MAPRLFRLMAKSGKKASGRVLEHEQQELQRRDRHLRRSYRAEIPVRPAPRESAERRAAKHDPSRWFSPGPVLTQDGIDRRCGTRCSAPGIVRCSSDTPIRGWCNAAEGLTLRQRTGKMRKVSTNRLTVSPGRHAIICISIVRILFRNKRVMGRKTSGRGFEASTEISLIGPSSRSSQR